ncbi:Sterol O-acyltransferase 2 (Sterol-ester synthase 2) [Batrachochytrium dendrobatidis]
MTSIEDQVVESADSKILVKKSVVTTEPELVVQADGSSKYIRRIITTTTTTTAKNKATELNASTTTASSSEVSALTSTLESKSENVTSNVTETEAEMLKVSASSESQAMDIKKAFIAESSSVGDEKNVSQSVNTVKHIVQDTKETIAAECSSSTDKKELSVKKSTMEVATEIYQKLATFIYSLTDKSSSSSVVKPPPVPLKKSTLLDVDRLELINSNLVGIYIIAQVCLVTFMICSCHAHYMRVGTLFDPVVYNIVFINIQSLFLAEFRLLLSTLPTLFIQQALASEFIPESASCAVLGVWESTWLVYWVALVSTSHFAWPQRVVLAVHVIILLMKQHSFMVTNNKIRQSHLKDGSPPSYESTAKVLDSDVAQTAASTSTNAEKDDRMFFLRNFTILHYGYWLAVPSLVYQTSFPQMPAFRPIHFAYYTAWTLISALGLYITLDHLIYPVMRDISINGFYHTFVYLIPGTIMYVFLVFLTVFEYALNAMAELTLLDERDFYDDWWNSLGYESFSRKWSTVVYRFLHKHVFLELKEYFNLSRPAAMFFTFTVSATLNELILFMVTGTFRTDYFRMITLQSLYIWTDYVMPPAKKSFGITGFWGGYFFGPPFIIIAYSRYFFEQN